MHISITLSQENRDLNSSHIVFCAGLEPARISTVDFESKRSGNLTY
ncbi:hypothetical protein CIT292_09232 [Citrobacter youngae ATCC 29220]|uniref:Uncharacterized protein n=1 Tax=Citrobacter youngae ATCC 29220 TaxID=500640 RepID=D4BG61_9ENTR|nr:hypothetical protein CIT292_09232 [Citrobacter youngae ATCC 29220]